MMPIKLRDYITEFKQEAVELALSTSSISDVAKQLSIPKDTLYTWIDIGYAADFLENPRCAVLSEVR